MRQQPLDFGVITGVGAGICIQFRLPLIGSDLIAKLLNLLTCVRQRIALTIESLHAMTADAATLIEQVFAEIQGVGALRHAIVRMAHLAARFGVLFMKKWMQPEWI